MNEQDPKSKKRSFLGQSLHNIKSMFSPPDFPSDMHYLKKLAFIAIIAIPSIMMWRQKYSLMSISLVSSIASLTKSGFGKAMSLVFMAEMFDKTFFVAMLLAMRTSKLFAFNASVAALGAMSLISAGLGAFMGNLPIATKTVLGFPIQELVTAGFLAYFGIKTLIESSEKTAAGEEEDAQEALGDFK